MFFNPIAESHVLTEEELKKVKVNWDELISCSTELLKYVECVRGGGGGYLCAPQGDSVLVLLHASVVCWFSYKPPPIP